MKSEQRNCQNCKNDFTIRSEDFLFYEKIKVPPPTFCPECRMTRRLLWRNERSLHRRDCGLCSKSIISMYSDIQASVYCSDCWSGNNWNQYKNAKEYDFSKTFFSQLKELFKINPRFYNYKFGNFINSEFVNFAKDNKNTYLSYSVIECEDVLYSMIIDKSKNSLDCFNVLKIDGCSYNMSCERNYNTHYSIKSQNCVDSYFLYDCINCSNCMLSSNLRNKQYYFNNFKYSKEEYLKKVEEYKLYSYSGFQKAIIDFDSLILNKAIHKYGFIYSSENVTGDYVHHSKNIHKSFDTYDSENVSYSFRVLYTKDSLDNSGVGYGELIYESMAATMNTFKDYFCYITTQGCNNCEYSLILKNCSNCFGCVGLTNASYCILNKQYSKEDYFEILPKIKQHMIDMPYIDSLGRVFAYGEFFPYDMSPFGYNETNAFDFFPISKEEASSGGYNWNDRSSRDYSCTQNFDSLPDSILDVEDSILEDTIECPNHGDYKTQCTEAFRIHPDELQFLRQKKLPLPKFCPNCRHYQRLKYRNPMRLYSRTCMNQNSPVYNGPCQNTFETTYSPDQLCKVYCEECYKREVL